MLKYPNRAVKAFIKCVPKSSFKKKRKSYLQWESNQALRVGVLPLYQVFLGGYRLSCTAYNICNSYTMGKSALPDIYAQA